MNLLIDLESATKEHEAAVTAESQARSAEIRAVNRLNAAQKAVDEHVAGLRAKAPRGTDWHHRGGAAVCR